MGFTRYWKLKVVPTEKECQLAIRDLVELFRHGEDNHVLEGTTISYTKFQISTNGIHGHEDFCVDLNNLDQKYCKTARKEYDKYVNAALRILKAHFKNDIDVSADDVNDEDEAEKLFKKYYRANISPLCGRYVYVDDKSNKFWECYPDTEGTYSTRWGRVGSKGTTGKIADAHQARKKILEKINKGYCLESPWEQIDEEVFGNVEILGNADDDSLDGFWEDLKNIV